MRKIVFVLLFLLFANIALAAEPECTQQTQANNTTEVGYTLDLYALCEDNIELKRAFLYTNETGEFKAKENKTIELNPSFVFFKFRGEPEHIGKTISWFIEAENAGNETVRTGNKSFIVVDTIKPEAIDQKQSEETINIDDEIELNVLWKDTGGIKEVELVTFKDDKEERVKKEIGIEFETEILIDQNASGETILSSAGISDKNFHTQSFIPSKKFLTGVELDFHRVIEPKGHLIVEIRKDLEGKPNMNLKSLSKLIFPSTNIEESDYYFVDLPDVDLTVGEKYHIVVKGTVETNIELKLYNPQTYGKGENFVSKDRGNTWISTNSDLLFKTYSGIVTPVKFPTEIWTNFTWKETDIKEDKKIDWKIYAKDIGGNLGESELMSFTVKTPDCPEYCTEKLKPGDCGGFGKCEKTNEEYWKSQICYKCSPETKWKCQPYINQETCEIKITEAEALKALKEVEEKIRAARLQIPKLDLTEAEILLGRAKDAYGDWETVKERAEETLKAIEDAPEYEPSECYEFSAKEECILGGCFWYENSCNEEPKPIGSWIYVVIVLIIIGIIFGFLWKTGKLKLPLKTKEVKEGDEKKIKRGTCSICGKSNRKLFTCKGCKTRACFKCVRKYREKIYCKACLRKRGLI